MKVYNLDAKGKKLGRLASEVASLLMGKNDPSFRKNIVPNVKVSVQNLSDLKLVEKKMDAKMYKNYSGYPGGLKLKTMRQKVEKTGNKEIFENAVWGMLPKNKLRKLMIKKLSIEE